MNTKTLYAFVLLLFLGLASTASAQCLSGNCENGKGKFQLSDGSVYEGSFKNGEIHGYGVCTYSDGSSYTGSWANRQPNGMGRKVYANGRTYDGRWEKGSPVSKQGEVVKQVALKEAQSETSIQSGCLTGDCSNGNGLYAFPDGSKYNGNFTDGILNGKGTWYFQNGVELKGKFKEGLPHGYGELVFDDEGNSLAGTWVDGEFITRDRSKVELGCVSGDCNSGKGTYVFNNGTAMYVGDFSNKLPDGYGKCFYVTGNVYEGYWFKGTFHGEGTLELASGMLVDGQWRFGNYQDNVLAFASKSGNQSKSVDNPGNPDEDEGFQYLAMVPPVSWQDFPGSNDGERSQESTTLNEETQIIEEPSPVNEEIQVLSYQAEAVTEQPAWEPPKEIDPVRAVGQSPKPRENTYSSTPVEIVQPRVWAVVVGVSSYHHMPALRYTDDDAYRIFAFLKSPEGGGLPDEQIKVLIDEDATKRNIVTAMMDVFYKAGPSDLVMLYFSGHGLKGSFLPFDFDGYSNKLYHHEVNDILKNSPANFKLCIADACHSGSLLSVKGGDLPSVLSNYYNHLAQMEPGSALLMSSKSEELSLESSGLRQGVFTHFLIRGLKGEADKDYDRAVSLEELYNFVTAGVQQYTRFRQTPLIKGKFDRSTIVSVTR